MPYKITLLNKKDPILSRLFKQHGNSTEFILDELSPMIRKYSSLGGLSIEEVTGTKGQFTEEDVEELLPEEARETAPKEAKQKKPAKKTATKKTGKK